MERKPLIQQPQLLYHVLPLEKVPCEYSPLLLTLWLTSCSGEAGHGTWGLFPSAQPRSAKPRQSFFDPLWPDKFCQPLSSPLISLLVIIVIVTAETSFMFDTKGFQQALARKQVSPPGVRNV